MNRAGLLNAREAVQSIAEYPSRSAQIAFGPVTDLLFGKTGDRIEAGDLGMAFLAQLDRRHKGHFVLRATPGLAPAFPAEIGIIHDHVTLQDSPCLAFRHHLHKLVLDPPGGGVPAGRRDPATGAERRRPAGDIRQMDVADSGWAAGSTGRAVRI